MANLAWLRRLGLRKAHPADGREKLTAMPAARRLVVEALEDRLPPGDVTSGFMAGGDPAPLDLEPATSAGHKPVDIVAVAAEMPRAPEFGESSEQSSPSRPLIANQADPIPFAPGEDFDPFKLFQSVSAAAMTINPGTSSSPLPSGNQHEGGTGGRGAGGQAGASNNSPTGGSGGSSLLLPPRSDPNAGVLGSQHLRELYRKFTQPDSDARINPNLQIDDQDRVMVQVRATNEAGYSSFRSRLENLGMQVLNTTPKAYMVTGWLPIAALGSLPSVASYSAVVPVFRPAHSTGSVNSEGDAVMRANLFRTNQSVTGAGVMVGVLSDSVSQVGGGLADSVGTGDLPNNVLVLQDGSSGDTDEGRAMLEIIYDVAPGSSLAFRTAFNGAADFADGIRELFAAGARVITDDVGYLNSPMFSTGRMGQAITEVTNAGAVYTTAAGNDGDDGWRATWTPRDATIDGVNGTFQDFGGTAQQTFTLASGNSIDIGFRWSEAYLEGGDPGANFQVDADFAVYVVDADDGTIVATQDDNNGNTDEAFELLSFSNDGSFGTNNFAFAFRLKSGPAPARLGWVQYSGPEINARDGGGPTQYGHALAPGAISTGATPASDPTSAESFSSRGGALELFADEQGNPLSTPLIVNKPDVTGPDGVHTTFFGQDDGNGGFQFFGTSAAAPHVAGAAALLLQQAPGATNVDVANHLRQTAVDIDAPGVDPVTGPGLVQLTPLTVTGIAPNTGPILPADVYERNDTSDTASRLGLLQPGQVNYTGLTISPDVNGLPDYDWYQVQMGSAGTFVLRCEGVADGLMLEAHLHTITAGFLTEVGAVAFSPQQPGTVALPVAPSSTVYVEIKGVSNGPGGAQRGGYNMTMGLA